MLRFHPGGIYGGDDIQLAFTIQNNNDNFQNIISK
jgi:hypothetical protein